MKKIKWWRVKKEKPQPKAPTAKIYVSTVQPSNRPSMEDWFKEFNVSLLHGKQAVFFGS